jgi:dihydroflavonol-4-reductase
MADLVLVTGAKGFIGWHVASTLLRAGYRVRGLTQSFRTPLPQEDPGIEWFEGDIRNPETLTEPMRDCRYLFHVAGDYRFWAPDKSAILETNIQGTINTLDTAWKAGIEKIVYTSTCSILAPNNGDEQTESHLAREHEVSSPYKRSKWLAYQEIFKRCSKGWPIITVLPTAPIGTCDLRPTPTGRIILHFLQGKFFMSARTGLNFADVKDVAQGHLLALNRGISGRRYLLGCQNLRLNEFLKKLEPYTKHRVPKFLAPYFLSRLLAQMSETSAIVHQREPMVTLEAVKASKHLHFFSSSHAISELGYQPKGIDSAIREAVEYFKQKEMV